MFVTHLSCSRCGRSHDHRIAANTCAACDSPLLVEYDLEAMGAVTSKEAVAAGPPTMWRYRDFLPIDGEPVTLGEGLTPLLPAPALGRRIGLPGLLVKDESPCPTGTFKARGAACGVSAAVERGIQEVALPTAGNAGGAWAAYGAAGGIRVHVAMPDDAPAANVAECRAYGADVTLVRGLISDAAAVVADGIREHGWFDVSTLREPYRIEGKKTLGLEIAEQLGWRAPDAIVYPCGGGVGAIGIHRAFEELRAIGWVDGPAPRLVVVQPEGCAPIVRAFREGREGSEAWPDARTIAAGLRVPKALGDFLVLRALRDTDGAAVAVSDGAILEAMGAFARDAGILACPEGAATLAGAARLREEGTLGQDDRVVLVNTGTALKYPELLGGVDRPA